MYSNLNCVIVIVFNYTCAYTRDYILIYLLHNRYNDKILLFIIVVVRTRFVSNHNSVGFAHKKSQTISFVERGFERLGLSHQAVSLFVMFIHG